MNSVFLSILKCLLLVNRMYGKRMSRAKRKRNESMVPVVRPALYPSLKKTARNPAQEAEMMEYKRPDLRDGCSVFISK